VGIVAGNIKAKRLLELQSSEHGFTPSFKKKADFLEYFQRIIDDKSSMRASGASRTMRERSGTCEGPGIPLQRHC
jgi:hypothetical protein